MPETYRNYTTKLNTTSSTVVYAGIDGVGIVNAIHTANISSGSADLSLFISKSSGEYYLIKEAAVAIQTSLQTLDASIPISGSGEHIYAKASYPDHLDVVVSVLEIT
jgi:hypothetical protein